MTESILNGDTIDDTLFYQILNAVKVKRESERLWQFLKKLNSSKTALSSDTFQTSKALPTDFAVDYFVNVGTQDNEYLPTPFEKQYVYQNAPNYYFIDLAGSVYYLTGKVSSTQTIYFFYLKTTSDIVSGTDFTDWPTRFQPILAFDVAAIQRGGVDFDDPNAKISEDNRATAKALHSGMVAWDTALKLRAMNKSAGPKTFIRSNINGVIDMNQ